MENCNLQTLVMVVMSLVDQYGFCVLGACVYTQRYYGEWTAAQSWIRVDDKSTV